MGSLWLLLAVIASIGTAQVLTPSQITISHRKPIKATSTCGEINGQPIREIYCSLAGSSQYSPYSDFSYQADQTDSNVMQELRNPREAISLGGHGCAHCEAGTRDAHPASAMVDGNTSWWQSPPLSRGMQYNEVNITIDLEQEFHVAYVWIQMAGSPKPSNWILERSSDFGKTYKPWFYFAANNAECERRFGAESLGMITEDDTVICRWDFSTIQPFENAEMVINLMEHRPSRHSFGTSEVLQNFTRATNVRIRLLGTRTLQGHLMDLNDQRDPTVTRRYFYAIKEILMGGRCVCNGHASTCDILDPKRPRALLCRCEHNTCGDMCESCCPGFLQKKWQPTTAHNNFTCEPCNCFGRSNECVYEEELDTEKKSLDIHGNYEGGGRCLNCRDFTEGINCNKCVFGYYKPEGVEWSQNMPCKPCQCNPDKHTGACSDGDGKCECQARFEGENCDKCAKGYYDAPECKKCECAVDGTENESCLPVDGQCPCKSGFGGTFCETCADGFTNFTAGCPECVCNEVGSEHSNCSAETGQCVCKSAFSGLSCDQCQLGYYGFPSCTYCNCDSMGTEGGKCDQETGQCLCKEGFMGERCDQCDAGYYGYPKCKPCNCDGAGSSSPHCDSTTGQCSCYNNFTSRVCDKCAAGFYDYPNCKTCSCLIEGAKGQTCDNSGQCYCKGNFEGERCDRCKPNFYNFPNCEECNCNPNGVTVEFAGCDKVAPGELCSCRKHVTGRICDQCKPTYWNLQYLNPHGCVDCGCHLNGTISALNICEQGSGQCFCKRNAGGRQCDKCAEGFYNLQSYNQLGCEPCNCDIGGAARGDCDINTGQCRCRPRVTGPRCDKPIKDHYFPTLWHNQYEAEDGHTADNRGVRFAVDGEQFQNFSWRGYAVFSPIQDKIILEVDVIKASVYRLLFKYKNPTSVPITAVVAISPRIAGSLDQEQSEKATFVPNEVPEIKEITVNGKPFVMNPGRWTLSISTKQRLFLDYVVVLPAEYYEGTILKERTPSPCHSDSIPNSTCIDLLYPPLRSTARVDVVDDKTSFKYVNIDGTTSDLELVPIEILPEIIGPAAYVRTGDSSKVIEAKIMVPTGDEYAVLVEYHNRDKTSFPVIIDIAQEGTTRLNGSINVQHCPFSTFCRELVTDMGSIPFVQLEEGEAVVQFRVDDMKQFGLASVNLVKKSDWNNEYLKQVPVCIRKNGKCLHQEYSPAANTVVAEAEAGSNAENAISGDKLPFPIANAQDFKVVPLDEAQGTLEIPGVVPARGHYLFMVHYFNPDNTPLDISVLLQYSDQFSEATVPLAYCPSYSGCRVLIQDKANPQSNRFFIDDKYTVSFYHNASQKGPIYINSVTPVPHQSFTESLMKPLPIDISSDFVKTCSENFFQNTPETVSDFCRDKIFSLTTDFNSAAFACDCTAKGSESFCCDEYGGQCKCKPNIIGRRCDRCAPGYHSYPECIKCKCGDGQQCDERTGTCFCPPHVEGDNCGKCVGNAFGYDALIGCQLCGCHHQGSEGGALQCDAEFGQCLCRESVGGRRCDRCLAGFYGFPNCYECRCNKAGTTEEVCDRSTAACHCKENVYGQACDTCKAGTFDLSAENPLGCVPCFCFGTTDQCRSSNLPVTISTMDLSSFTTNDAQGTLSVNDDVITYTSADGSPSSVYFNAPIQQGKDYTNSYGLMLGVKLAVTAKEDIKKMSSEADIRLYGNNLTAEFWASEQPANPEQTFAVRARLVPENFLTPAGKALTREELMMLLYNLQNITIKASYYESPATVTLYEFGLETTVKDRSFDSVLRASSVEECVCPAPYTGASCQQCAEGYYRVDGNYLGACVPCDCNGHSGTCDAQTGVCSNCEDNTHGDHCEFCDEGHYGDATTGSPYSCMACACAYPPDNNFAVSCKVSVYGELEKCECKPGYAGERCDRCDAGYYGEPNRPGGSCQPCQCNNNNNLTDARACHPISGDCYLCENHTDGRRCEWCSAWYHGDAIEAKNCTSCECDQCGSERCDNREGVCTCKQNVVGDSCNRCAPDHYGFSKCRGCEQCYCGVASSSTQCHPESGQCACRPGAAGQRCEHCEHGFWNYGEHGCQKCDCEADLSMGTVCDVRTGQCHCQEGATGSRCDQCEKSYLRIPTLGCRRCDECVHHLIADTYLLEDQIGLLNTSISNISSATVVGARLSRSRKELSNLQELSNILTNSDNEYNNFIGDAKAVLTSKSNLFNNANRSSAVATNDAARVHNLTEEGPKTMQDIRLRVSQSLHTINGIRELARSIGSHSSALNVDPRWLKDAERILMELETASADAPSDKITDVPAKIEELNNNLKPFLEKLTMHHDKIEAAKKKAENIHEYLADAQKLLKESANKADKAVRDSHSTSMFKVEGLSNAISADLEKLAESKNNANNIILEINNNTESTRDHREAITSSLSNLSEIRAEVMEAVESRRVKRETPFDVAPVSQKAQELEDQVASLKSSIGDTQSAATNAVAAANAYSNLTNSLTNAKDNSQNAIDVVAEKQSDIDTLKADVTESLEKSKKLNEEARQLKGEQLRDISSKFEETEKDIDRLTQQIDGMRNKRTELHNSLTSPLKENSLETIDDQIEQVNDRKKEIDESLESTRTQITETSAAADQAVSQQTDAVQGVKTARNNLKTLSELTPVLTASFDKMKYVRGNRTSKIDLCNEKMNQVKEMIAVARDAANRIRLGAHFEQGSSLDLNMPIRVSQSAAHTDVSFYFRTSNENGIPFFFGNEEGSAGTRAVPTDDFIAVEIEQGKPKVTIDLGDSANVIKLDTSVADNQWRRIDVERIGKSATVSLSKINSDDVEETKKSVSLGNKSVLNLHQTMSKLYVGGIPAGIKIDKEIRNRGFSGDIEELVLHGEPVGLWNAKDGGMVNVNGATKRVRTGVNANGGVSLNGDGYIVHEMGHWNPRKRTVFSTQFLTYSPEGLLLFLGKDRDFLAIELNLGSVKLSVDFGAGLGSWTSEQSNYNDGKWHTVSIMREGVHVKMEIDGQHTYEGDAPGDLTELSVTDKFYLGGVPSGVNTRTPVSPLKGCIRAVRLNSDEMDLTGKGVRASKGLRNTCPLGVVRTVSLLSDRSSANFANVAGNKEGMEVTLRFKTREPKGVLLTVRSDDEEHLLQLSIDNGVVSARAVEDNLNIELASASDEQWHFISVKKNKANLQVDIDDIYSQSLARSSSVDENGDNVAINFGKQADGSYVGCIGDVTFNGQILDFAKADIKELSLTGCSLRDDEVKTTVAPTSAPENQEQQPSEGDEETTYPTESTVKPSASQSTNTLRPQALTSTLQPIVFPKLPIKPTAEPRPDGACALPREARGTLADNEGTRFGVYPNSRLEYGSHDSFDKSGTFSLSIRATAANGVIMFASNEKQSDYIGLFIQNGRVLFGYNTGGDATFLRTNHSILDGEWHTVRASRKGTEGNLIVDDESVDIIKGQESESIDTRSPLFLGGLPSELAAFVRTIVPGVKSEFGGCIRDFKLNDKKMEVVPQEFSTTPCSLLNENGLYFGHNGGYAILKKDYHVGQSFVADIDIRPRVQEAVLFAVGKTEYLTVQMINGTIKFTIDSGAGPESLIFKPGKQQSLCDGHWHSVKIMKKKNLMTLTVDGKSNLHIMKKNKKPETVTNDPIYLGGVPEGVVSKGLDTRENYVGCLRISNYGDKKSRVIRRKKQLDIKKIETFGDVNREECPLN